MTVKSLRLTAVAAAILLITGLTACGSDKSSAPANSAPVSGAQKVMGMSFCYLSNSAMISFRDAEKQAAEALGWKVLEPTNANNSQSQQLTDINNLLTQGVAGLDIHACSQDGVVPGILAANKKNVPVFLPDQSASGGKVAVTVQVDNVASAANMCDEYIKTMTGHGRPLTGSLIEVQGDIASQAGKDRTKGFEDCMKEKAPSVKILTVPTKWDAASGSAGTSALLIAHHDVTGIFMESDIVFSAAIEVVLKKLNLIKPADDPSHLVLFGIDGGCDMLGQIRDATADFTSSSPLNQYGKVGIPFLDLARDGKLDTIKPNTASTVEGSQGLPITELPTGLQIIVPDVTTTKANVDDPKQWSNATGC